MSSVDNISKKDDDEGEFLALSEGLDASISEGDDSYFLLSYLMKRRQQQGRSILNKNNSPTSAGISSPFNTNVTPLFAGRKLKVSRDKEKHTQDNDNNDDDIIQGKIKTLEVDTKDNDVYDEDFEVESPDNLSKSVMSFIDKSRSRMAIKSLASSSFKITSPKVSVASPSNKASSNISPTKRPLSPQSTKGIQADVPQLPAPRVPYPGYSTESLQIKSEVEETEDIKVLRQLLRNSIADQFSLSKSSQSIMQDNKQLNDENKALQLRVASLQHSLVLTTRKFKLPMNLWHKLNQVITYKRSKAFEKWRQVMHDHVLDRRMANYCCYNVTIKRYRRLQKSAIQNWKEGIKFNEKMSRILKVSENKVAYKTFRKWMKFVKIVKSVSLTRKLSITHGFSLLASVSRGCNVFMTSKSFHKWVSFLRYCEQKDMEKLMLERQKQSRFEMSKEKAKGIAKSIVRIRHFFMRRAIGQWRFVIFHLEYKINMGRKVILGQARRFQRKTLAVWKKYTDWDRRIKTFTKEVPWRIKCRIFKSWKKIHNILAGDIVHIKAGQKLLMSVLRRKNQLFKHKFFMRWMKWNVNITTIMHSETFKKHRMRSIIQQLFSTTEDTIRGYFKKWLYNTTVVNHAQERARNVILRWLRREQKCGLNKWKEYVHWHRRITGLFDQGPERRKSEVLRKWKEYNLWCHNISKHGKEGARIILTKLVNTFTYIKMKRFHQWKSSAIAMKINQMQNNAERELMIKYVTKMQNIATALVREAFRMWWIASFYNDKLRDRSRNVIIGWLKRYKKQALSKWIECTNWHRRVTRFFDVGPTRMKAAMIRRWKQYTMQNRNLMPLKRQGSRILYAVASRRALLKCNRAFSRWVLVNHSYRSKKLLDYIQIAREKTLKQKMKYYIQLLCSKGQVLVRDAFRQWQASLLFQDRQIYVGKKVILRWYRRNQRIALEKWKHFVSWHGNVLKVFNVGNKRLGKRIFLRWRSYAAKRKKLLKLAQEGSLKLVSVVRRRLLILIARRFYQWKRESNHIAMVRYNILKWRAIVRGNRKRKVEAINHIFSNIKKSLDRKIQRCYHLWRRATMLSKLKFPSLCNKWFRRWTNFTAIKKLKKSVRKRTLYPILLKKFREQLVVAMKKWKRHINQEIKISKAHKGIRSIRLAFKHKFLYQCVQKRFWKWRDIARRETRIANVLNKCTSKKKASTLEAGFKLWKCNCEYRKSYEKTLRNAANKIISHRKVVQSLAFHVWRVHGKIISSEKILISKITDIARDQKLKSMNYNAQIVSQNIKRQGLYKCFRFWRSVAKKLAVPLGGSVIINALTAGRVWSDKIRNMSKVDKIPKPQDAVQIALAALSDILSPISYKPSVFFKQSDTTLYGAHYNDDDNNPSDMDPRNTSLSTIYNTSRNGKDQSNLFGLSDSPIKSKTLKLNVITMGVGIIGKCAESGKMKVFRGDLKSSAKASSALAVVLPLLWDGNLVAVLQFTVMGLDCNSVFVESNTETTGARYQTTPNFKQSAILSPISQSKSFLDTSIENAISQQQYPDLYQVALALNLNREQLTTLGIVILELCEFFGRYYAVGNTEGDRTRAIMHQIAEYPKLIELKVSQEELRQRYRYLEEEYSQANERIKTQSLLIEKLEKSRQKYNSLADEKSKLLDETKSQLDELKDLLHSSEKRAKHFEKQLEEVHKLETILNTVISRDN